MLCDVNVSQWQESSLADKMKILDLEDPFQHPNGNIVIADDDDKVCATLKKQFEGQGYGVYICQSLADLMTLNHHNVSCVIMDINLDDNEAFQAIEMIRQSPLEGDVPILITSDVPSTDLMIRGLDAGADDYILKPFTMRELNARVQSAMKMRGFA